MKMISTLLITLAFVLSSCTTTEHRQFARAIASKEFLKKVDGNEPIPEGVRGLLNEEQNLHNKDLWGANAFDTNIAPEYIPENNPKFPLAYYLLPEEEAKFLRADSLDKRISDQLVEMKDGKKYFKLFVHPESEAHYEFLKETYQYVSQSETEFTASPTSSYRSLIVWNKNKKKKSFIAKVSLDRNVIGSIDRLVSENEVERSVANQKVFDRIGSAELEKMHVKVFPESAGLVLDQEMPGAPKKLGGQLIREIPDNVVESKTKWLSFSALMSPNKKPRPLIMDVIKASGLSSYDFYEKYMIDSYMKMFEELSLKGGMNFEPHSQNLCFEVGMDLKPTDNWVLRDFGGVWPDVITMAKNGGPVDTYMEAGSAAKYKLRGGRGNYISSYVFFYKRQVFDMMLGEVAKHDKSMTPKMMEKLKGKLDGIYVEKINKYFRIKIKDAPTMANYKQVEEKILKNTMLDKSVSKQEIEYSAEVKKFISMKQNKGEYIELDGDNKVKSYFVTDHGVYETNGDKIVGVSFYTKEEKADFLNHTGVFAQFKMKLPTTGENCWGMIKSFLGK